MSWLALGFGIVAVAIPGIPAATTGHLSGYGSHMLWIGAIPVAIIAVVLGGIALRLKAAAKGAAIAGLLLGALEIVVAIVMFISYLFWSSMIFGMIGR